MLPLPPATVRALLELGADVHAAAADGMTPMHYAAINQDGFSSEIITILVEFGGDVNGEGKGRYTPIMLAVELSLHPDAVDTVRTLAKLGANVNYSDTSGSTVASIAQECRRPDVVAALSTFGLKGVPGNS